MIILFLIIYFIKIFYSCIKCFLYHIDYTKDVRAFTFMVWRLSKHNAGMELKMIQAVI